jgi:DNA-directed RNA polymerase sigma subunit (sigma70/sigma32)
VSEATQEQEIEQKELREGIDKMLLTITPREAKVIKMRFGMDDSSEHTFKEVGQSFAVTPERIRQIEAKALRKLRHPYRWMMLINAAPSPYQQEMKERIKTMRPEFIAGQRDWQGRA